MSYTLLFDLKSSNSVEKAADGQKIYRAVASTDALDRDKEVLVPKGVQVENFMKNPVMLFIHQSKQLPVGKILKLEVNDSEIAMDFVFAPTEIGKELQDLYDGGFMSAFSVGFYPKNYIFIEENTPKNLDITLQNGSKYSLDLTKYAEIPRAVVTDWELLEVSPVPIPSNPEALLRRSMDEAIRKDGSNFLAKAKLEHKFNDLAKSIESFLKEAEHPEDSGAVPFDSSIIDKESKWDKLKCVASLAKRASSDGSGSKDTLDWAKYSEGFTWVNLEKTQELRSYKLPHHFVNKEGELRVSLFAVREALASLLSEDQGNVAEKDVEACYNHLKLHYVEAGEECPELKSYSEDELQKIREGKSLSADSKVSEEENSEESVGSKEQIASDEFFSKIESLSEKISEVGEELLVRMGILFDIVDETNHNVCKLTSNTEVSHKDPEDEGEGEGDDESGDPDQTVLEEIKKASESLKSFLKSE